MTTHGNLLVLNRKQVEVWVELFEAAKDYLLGWKHDGGCIGWDDDDDCSRCNEAITKRRQRLEAAVEAAGPEAEKIKEMFGPFKKE